MTSRLTRPIAYIYIRALAVFAGANAIVATTAPAGRRFSAC